MEVKDQIKKILEPHYGHLNFLMKIKKDEISIDDISNLVDLMKDKNLVNNLPKTLHSYNSYYTLMKDFFFVKKNITLIKVLKDNLSPKPKDIILGLLDDTLVNKRLRHIISNDDLKSTFFRWSSRINDEEFARFYIKSVIEDSKIWDELNGEQAKIIELYDHSLQSQYIPASWCIKRKGTFDQYLRSQRIFIYKYQGKVYGVNLPKRRISYFYDHVPSEYELDMSMNITIQDSKNKPVNRYNNPGLYKAAKTELLRLNLFGRDNKASRGVVSSTPKAGAYMGWSFVNVFRRIRRFLGFR